MFSTSDTGRRCHMIEIVPNGTTAWEWECRHARRDADPANANAHVADWRRQPGHFEKYVLPKLKQKAEA